MGENGTTASAGTLTDPVTEAERWVAGFAEGWRAPTGAGAFVEHFRSLLAPDIRLIQPQIPTLVGFRAFEEQFVAPLFELIEGVHGEVERWASRGDALYIELTLSGRLGGREVRWRVCDRVRLRAGVAIERESYYDPTPLLTAVARTPRAWPRFVRLRARDSSGSPSAANRSRAQPNRTKEQTMNEVRLSQGTIRYRETGAGEPIVLVHGLLTDGELWREVAPRLAADFRVLAPDWPLGSHQLAMDRGADLSPLGLAAMIAEFIATLELERVTLVGNDTGGALCQLVAAHHPKRLGRLVLTPCDAYENFLPPAFRPLQWLARVPGSVFALAQSMRPAPMRRLPIAYGMVSRRADAALTRSWIEPALASAQVRRDVAAVLKGISNRYTLEAAQRFGEFTQPVLIAWAPEDRFFKLSYGEKLAQAFPNARLELIEDSLTFVPVDQPRRTSELIAAFAREPVSTSSVSTS